MNVKPTNDLKLSGFGADPVERIFKATRAYLDAPSGIDIGCDLSAHRFSPGSHVRAAAWPKLLSATTILAHETLDHCRIDLQRLRRLRGRGR
jgi:hypothetical protein